MRRTFRVPAKTLILLAAILLLAHAAKAEDLPGRGMSGKCWKWNPQGMYHEWSCNGGDPGREARQRASDRDTREQYARSRDWNTQSNTVWTDSNGQTSSSITNTTTTPPVRR